MKNVVLIIVIANFVCVGTFFGLKQCFDSRLQESENKFQKEIEKQNNEFQKEIEKQNDDYKRLYRMYKSEEGMKIEYARKYRDISNVYDEYHSSTEKQKADYVRLVEDFKRATTALSRANEENKRLLDLYNYAEARRKKLLAKLEANGPDNKIKFPGL